MECGPTGRNVPCSVGSEETKIHPLGLCDPTGIAAARLHPNAVADRRFHRSQTPGTGHTGSPIRSVRQSG
jgi:hypothetical protein